MSVEKRLINPNPTESHKILLYGKAKNWSKSEYVMYTGPVNVHDTQAGQPILGYFYSNENSHALKWKEI